NDTESFFDVIGSGNNIQDPKQPETIENPRGERRIENVHFRYQDDTSDHPDLIDGINLELHPGETMALVGLTGSGKTTITALACRLYDVTDGAVILDGVDIRNLTRQELRKHVAMAFEDAILFSDSVRNNVLLGNADA